MAPLNASTKAASNNTSPSSSKTLKKGGNSKSTALSSRSSSPPGGSGCTCGHAHGPQHSAASAGYPKPKPSAGLLPPSSASTTSPSRKPYSRGGVAGSGLKSSEIRAFAHVDRLLSRIFWLRFYQDAARLYSARLTIITKERLPFLIQNVIAAGGGPGWAAINANCEEIKEFFRLQIQVDLREIEDRIWHSSGEWTYTAIRRMALSNGYKIPSSGLRATDLLKMVPLLEAMLGELENAPKDCFEINPVGPIAGTFLNLSEPVSRMEKAQPNGGKKTSRYNPDHLFPFANTNRCAHHPNAVCSTEVMGTPPPWGATLYKITSSALGPTAPPTSSSSGKSKEALSTNTPAGLSAASTLLDVLFPSLVSPLPPTKLNSKRSSRVGTKGDPIPRPPGGFGFTEDEMFLAQIELRGILALGLSRLAIVLFQTAQEFNLKAFGENVNLAFGGRPAGTHSARTMGGSRTKLGKSRISDNGKGTYKRDGVSGRLQRRRKDWAGDHGYIYGNFDDTDEDELDGDYYGGCECCYNDHQDSYSDKNGSKGNGTSPSDSLRSRYDDPLYDLWNSTTSSSGSTGKGKKARKRTRLNEGSDTDAAEREEEPIVYRRNWSAKPGSGLKGWDTVLHYEAVIREEEEERIKKEQAPSEKKPPSPVNGKAPVSDGALEKMDKKEVIRDLAAIALGEGQVKQRRAGKAREGIESDGRGGGLLGWNSCHEEDVWERDLDSTDDFGIEDYFGFGKDRDEDPADSCRCQRVAMRYLIAEEYKEDGNVSFKAGDFSSSIALYTLAHKSEPRLPIYLLNRAMALLRLNRWKEAERDCTLVLRKHRTNAKALWRRAKARRMLAAERGGMPEKLIEAERDLIDFLALLPNSIEGHAELASLRAELCACFECSEATVFNTTQSAVPAPTSNGMSGTAVSTSPLSFCSTSSTHPPTSCFNKNYRPAPALTCNSSSQKGVEENPLKKGLETLASVPQGWLNIPNPTFFPNANGGGVGTKSKAGQGQNARHQPSFYKLLPPVFNITATTPTRPSSPTATKSAARAPATAAGGQTYTYSLPDPKDWAEYVKDFSRYPHSVGTQEDRLHLRFISDHDLPSANLPTWDLYRVVRGK